MIRRSWRDLQSDDDANGDSTESSSSNNARDQATERVGDLQQAASMVPGGRLEELLRERQQLEQHIANISGNNRETDARDDARFSVLSFAERQQQERDWLRRHEANNARRDNEQRTGLMSGLSSLTSGLGSNQGLPDRSGLRSGFQGALDGRDATRERFRGASRSNNEGLNALGGLRQAGRNIANQANSMSNQMRGLDRQLTENDVSQEDRDEIRRLIKADKIDKVSSGMSKANKSLDAPKNLVGGIERGWQEKEKLLTGALDKIGPYAELRDRRLSSDTGGSGDLFERMKRNRQRALERRREKQIEEKRDQQRRDRAKQRKAEEKKRGRV